MRIINSNLNIILFTLLYVASAPSFANVVASISQSSKVEIDGVLYSQRTVACKRTSEVVKLLKKSSEAKWCYNTITKSCSGDKLIAANKACKLARANIKKAKHVERNVSTDTNNQPIRNQLLVELKLIQERRDAIRARIEFLNTLSKKLESDL